MSESPGYLKPSSLYPDESEIARYILGKKAKQWTKIAPILEREGLPRIDPLTGGRFWPAVRAFLDRRHGLRKDLVPASADGEESW
jgi:hypothetical protein